MKTETKALDLRGLTKAERDVKVTRAIAELNGWSWIEDGAPLGTWVENGKVVTHTPPPYATSADAVLPLLEKAKADKLVCGIEMLHNYDGEWTCWLHSFHRDQELAFETIENDLDAKAPTFPLAACYALLRANGYEVLMS